jgi:hypothetical protein
MLPHPENLAVGSEYLLRVRVDGKTSEMVVGTFSGMDVSKGRLFLRFRDAAEDTSEVWIAWVEIEQLVLVQ